MINNISKNVFFTLIIFISVNFINYFCTDSFKFYSDYIFYTIPFFIIYLCIVKDELNNYFNIFILSFVISILSINMMLIYFQIFLICLLINLIFFNLIFFKKFNNQIITILSFLYFLFSGFLVYEVFNFVEFKITDKFFIYIITLYYQASTFIYFKFFLINKININNNNKFFNNLIYSLLSPFLIFFRIFKK